MKIPSFLHTKGHLTRNVQLGLLATAPAVFALAPDLVQAAGDLNDTARRFTELTGNFYDAFKFFFTVVGFIIVCVALLKIVSAQPQDKTGKYFIHIIVGCLLAAALWLLEAFGNTLLDDDAVYSEALGYHFIVGDPSDPFRRIV